MNKVKIANGHVNAQGGAKTTEAPDADHLNETPSQNCVSGNRRDR
jgi:hypothetical protein